MFTSDIVLWVTKMVVCFDNDWTKSSEMHQKIKSLTTLINLIDWFQGPSRRVTGSTKCIILKVRWKEDNVTLFKNESENGRGVDRDNMWVADFSELRKVCLYLWDPWGAFLTHLCGALVQRGFLSLIGYGWGWGGGGDDEAFYSSCLLQISDNGTKEGLFFDTNLMVIHIRLPVWPQYMHF